MTRDEMIQLTRELTGRQYTSLPKSFDELQEYTDRVIRAALAEPIVTSDYPNSHQLKPLTDAKINAISMQYAQVTKFARAIEEAHGIIP